MTEDQKTYQRAVSVSLLGLGVQILVAVSLLILWLWSKNEVLASAFYHGLGGLGLWAALWALFMQHKRERAEALDAEQIARRHGTDTSIFETSADDLAVAQKRLRWLYRWMVPVVSLATSAYLITLGTIVLRQNARRVDAIAVPEENALGLMAATAGIAFVGFLISRYLAGMAKVPQWQLLRSGASYLMGNVLVALLLAISMLLINFDFHWLFRAMIYIVPIFMILVGVEIVLNFVLNLYRPRKAGETPRPAFDSRLLSFLTSPESIAKSIGEAINYQFGFEITRSWFWQLLSRVFGWLLLLGVVVILLVSCLVVVEPNQRAVVTRFGERRAVFEAGPHLKLPWPIEQAEFYDVHSIRVITIGKAENPDEQAYFREVRDPMESPVTDEKVVLWSNRHMEDELNLIVAPPPDAPRYDRDELPQETPSESDAAAGPAGEPVSKAVPISLVNAEVMVLYRVHPDRLIEYINANADAAEVEDKHQRAVRQRAGWSAQQREQDKFKPAPNVHADRVRNLAVSQVTRFLLQNTVDEWIGSASVKVGEELLEVIRKEAEPLGVEVTEVLIAGIHPPQKVADAFHEVINAQQQRETTIENADRDAIRIKVEAAGSVENAQRINKLIVERDRLRATAASQEELAEVERKIDDLLRRAGGQTAVIIAQARADRWTLENRERGRALAFEAQRQAYRAAPAFYTARKYLEVLSKGLADANKFIIAADRTDLTIRSDHKEIETRFGSFDKPDER